MGEALIANPRRPPGAEQAAFFVTSDSAVYTAPAALSPLRVGRKWLLSQSPRIVFCLWWGDFDTTHCGGGILIGISSNDNVLTSSAELRASRRSYRAALKSADGFSRVTAV